MHIPSVVFSFFNMGGYGLYVWSAYGAMLLIIILNLCLPLRRFKKLQEQLRSDN